MRWDNQEGGYYLDGNAAAARRAEARGDVLEAEIQRVLSAARTWGREYAVRALRGLAEACAGEDGQRVELALAKAEGALVWVYRGAAVEVRVAASSPTMAEAGLVAYAEERGLKVESRLEGWQARACGGPGGWVAGEVATPEDRERLAPLISRYTGAPVVGVWLDGSGRVWEGQSPAVAEPQAALSVHGLYLGGSRVQLDPEPEVGTAWDVSVSGGCGGYAEIVWPTTPRT